MRPLHQIILSFLFIFIQILMLLILVIAQFPEENLVYFSSTEVHLVCSTSKAQIILSHLYNLILIVICTYYAFKTRHVPGPYNEAKVIAFAMYSSCLIIFSFIIMFAVAASRGADRIFQLAIHSYRVVLLASVILLCFFGPKTYLIIFHNGSTPSIWLSSNQDGKTGSTRRRDEAHSR
jgi:archaellum biogenesis protein FlaJ (TadC family)